MNLKENAGSDQDTNQPQILIGLSYGHLFQSFLQRNKIMLDNRDYI